MVCQGSHHHQWLLKKKKQKAGGRVTGECKDKHESVLARRAPLLLSATTPLHLLLTSTDLSVSTKTEVLYRWFFFVVLSGFCL